MDIALEGPERGRRRPRCQDGHGRGGADGAAITALAIGGAVGLVLAGVILAIVTWDDARVIAIDQDDVQAGGDHGRGTGAEGQQQREKAVSEVGSHDPKRMGCTPQAVKSPP